jgi:hypothetical protein
MAEATRNDDLPEMAQLEIRKGPNSEVVVGGLRIVACRREVGSIDGGITVYVWNDSSDSPVELVRMDLFRERPHYHAPAENQSESVIEAGSEGANRWCVEALTTRAAQLADEAGYTQIGAALDLEMLACAGPAIQSLFDELEDLNEVSNFEVPVSVLEGLRH